MKKVLALFLAFAFLVGAPSLAFEPQEVMKQSTTKTADASITTVPGYFYGFMVDSSAVTVEVTFDIYDSGSTVTSTFLLPTFGINLGSGVTEPFSIFLPYPIPYDSGIYVDGTSTGAIPSYKIFYMER